MSVSYEGPSNPTPTPTQQPLRTARIGGAAMGMSSGCGLDGVIGRRASQQPLSAASFPDPASDLLSTMVEQCDRATSSRDGEIDRRPGRQGAGSGNGIAVGSSVAHRYQLSTPTQHSDFQQPSSRRRVRRLPHSRFKIQDIQHRPEGQCNADQRGNADQRPGQKLGKSHKPPHKSAQCSDFT